MRQLIKTVEKRVKNYLKIRLKRFWKYISPAYRATLREEANVKKILQWQTRQDYLFWISQNIPGELMSETKRRVFANLPPAEGVLHECQEVLNFLLQETNRVCRQNNLSYWLMGGTLIGAIRHKGFIPWDDDADIGMMRKDYERFKILLENNPHIELLEYYNFNGYYRIPKIVIRNSNSMLAVDIVVFDYTNSNERPLETIWKEQQEVRTAYILALKKFKWHVLEMRGTEIIKDSLKFQKADELTNTYIEKCNYLPEDGNIIIWGIDNFTSRARDRKRIYTKESIFPLRELEFEGMSYYVVNDYMDMIVREAGDIWVFPSDAGNSKMFSLTRQKLELEKAKQVLDEDFFNEK